MQSLYQSFNKVHCCLIYQHSPCSSEHARGFPLPKFSSLRASCHHHQLQPVLPGKCRASQPPSPSSNPEADYIISWSSHEGPLINNAAHEQEPAAEAAAQPGSTRKQQLAMEDAEHATPCGTHAESRSLQASVTARQQPSPRSRRQLKQQRLFDSKPQGAQQPSQAAQHHQQPQQQTMTNSKTTGTTTAPAPCTRPERQAQQQQHPLQQNLPQPGSRTANSNPHFAASTAVGTSSKRHSGGKHSRSMSPQAVGARNMQQQASSRNKGNAAPADDYQQAQQRVRAALAAADPSNPAAAAEQLQDTVNDMVIALQLLATAPRPNSLAAHRQYEAAVQQLAAAVLKKYKRLLLSKQQEQQELLLSIGQPSAVAPAASSAASARADATAAAAAAAPHLQQLAAAIAGLPATKVAATTFALGVLREYDMQTVPALELGSLQLLRKAAFNANQLGQLVQGFVYLGHPLNPEWHLSFIEATRAQVSSMRGPQLTSLAAWLITYVLLGSQAGGSSSGSASNSAHWAGFTHNSSSSSLSYRQSAAMAPAAAVVHSVPGPDAGWVQAYFTAISKHAAGLKPLQLAQVLQAAAGLYQRHMQQQQQQQQQDSTSSWVSSASSTPAPAPASAASTWRGAGDQLQYTLQVFQGLPLAVTLTGSSHIAAQDGIEPRAGSRQHQQQSPRLGKQQPWKSGSCHVSKNSGNSRTPAQGDTTSSGSSDSDRGTITAATWLLPLLSAFQQQLPEFKMNHLAAALPALACLTVHPWPKQEIRPLVLQVQLLLPSCAGADLVATAQNVALLADPQALSADREWTDALLTRLHAVLPTLGPSGLAGAVQVLAMLQLKPYKAWIYALCQRLRVDAKLLTAEQVLVVLEGLASIGVQLDPEVLHLFVLGINRWMGVLGPDELAVLVAALRKMYPRALPGRTVQQLVEEMERRQHFLRLEQQRQQQLFG